jgi:hypothetical protein
MERMAWTDERLDDLSRRVDVGFERVERDMRDLRSEMRAGFADLRGEMQTETAGLRGEIEQLRTVMYRFGVVVMGTLVASMILDRV